MYTFAGGLRLLFCPTHHSPYNCMSRSSSFFRQFTAAASGTRARPAFSSMAATVVLTKIKHEQRPAHHVNDSQSVSMCIFMKNCAADLMLASKLFENPWPSFIKENQVGTYKTIWSCMDYMVTIDTPGLRSDHKDA